MITFSGPILVDQLFHLVTAKFPQSQWFSMFKTPNDLSTFLKLFANCFHIQANLVTLLQKPILSDIHIQNQQARTKDCVNNNVSTLSVSRTESPILRGNTIDTITSVGDFKLNEPVSNMKITTLSNCNNNNNNINRSEPNSGFDSYIPDFDVKLENLCENNLPKVATTANSPSSNTNSTPSSNNISPALSPVPPANTPASGPISSSQTAERSVYAGNKNQSLKQRINNLVIKTLAENSEKDKQTINVYQNNQINNQNTTGTNASTNSGAQLAASIANNSPDHCNNLFNGDTWKIKVLQHTRVIATIKESIFVTEAILKSTSNNEPVIISLDCEGINLGIKGELTLIEIGTVRGEAFIFDVLTCPDIITEGGLKALLENDKVIKVIHDCRNDSVNLYSQFKVLLRNVFDTQVKSHCDLKKNTCVPRTNIKNIIFIYFFYI